ncbi:hypothetical protein BSLG_001520 [Batrachochytrium salamandrivorans]|nr:hypothetical protein BSLG_001520 [Batrachochytrium salamandrivorans]
MISTPSTIYVFAALLAAATNSGLVSAQSLPYGLCNKANFQYSTIVGTPAATFPIAQIPLVTTSGAPDCKGIHSYCRWLHCKWYYNHVTFVIACSSRSSVFFMLGWLQPLSGLALILK